MARGLQPAFPSAVGSRSTIVDEKDTFNSEIFSTCNHHVKFTSINSQEFHACISYMPAHMLGTDTHVRAMKNNFKQFSTCSEHVLCTVINSRKYQTCMYLYCPRWYENMSSPKGLGPNLGGREGILKNVSSQAKSAARLTFLVLFRFLSRGPEKFRQFLGSLWMILCYWKTFLVPNFWEPKPNWM